MFYRLLASGEFERFADRFAVIHREGYPLNHLTANFSQVKLAEYYRCLVAASDLVVIAMDNGNSATLARPDAVHGFIVAGASASAGVADFLRHNRVYVLGVLLRHPFLLLGKIRSLFLRLWRKGLSREKLRLLSICVDSRAPLGAGRGMLEFFEDVLASRGIRGYGLSVRKSNIRAVSFYERNGFTLEACRSGLLYYAKRLA